MKISLDELHHLVLHPEIHTDRRIGTTAMEAYGVAAQISMWLDSPEGIGCKVWWIIPQYAWGLNCQNALVNALEDYGIEILTVQRNMVTFARGISVEFIGVMEIEKRVLGLDERKNMLAGFHEIPKWGWGNYPDWIYMNILDTEAVPVDRNFRL